jgi:hypothetical protein
MADQLAALKGLEGAVLELHYLAVLWAKIENEALPGEHQPDGTFLARYESYDVAGMHSWLGFEVERRAAALRRDFLAAFDLPTGGANG